MTLNLNSREFQQNPYDLYTRLREQEPISSVDSLLFSAGKGLFITRYDDVLAVLKDPCFSVERRKLGDGRDVSKAWWIPGILRAFLNSMVMVDNPDHARLRTLVHKAFTPRMIQQMTTRIKEISYSLLDQMSEKTEVDLIADFALPLPLTVISEMMGVPLEDRHRFHKMMSKFLDTSTLGSTLQQFPNAIMLHRFFKKLIALRRKDPHDDLITALVQAEEQSDSLSEDELIAMLLLLLLAGHETTVNLIGNGTLALLQYPDQFEKLKANPKLLETAIEEMLRFTNPVHQISPRYVIQDVELHGQLIPKGTTVIVGIASANRDETVFQNADQFDITRTPNPHIAFGLGIHYCLGAPLARLEGQIAFRVLLERFPNLELVASASKLEWRGGPALRGLNRLPLRLNSKA
ncbi:MAG TPA: cytochrome P450 [Phototrophicaceae bacterium]|nr:cytochrome P450 [Phototrophicaceae bacterium]